MHNTSKFENILMDAMMDTGNCSFFTTKMKINDDLQKTAEETIDP